MVDAAGASPFQGTTTPLTPLTPLTRTSGTQQDSLNQAKHNNDNNNNNSNNSGHDNASRCRTMTMMLAEVMAEERNVEIEFYRSGFGSESETESEPEPEPEPEHKPFLFVFLVLCHLLILSSWCFLCAALKMKAEVRVAGRGVCVQDVVEPVGSQRPERGGGGAMVVVNDLHIASLLRFFSMFGSRTITTTETCCKCCVCQQDSPFFCSVRE